MPAVDFEAYFSDYLCLLIVQTNQSASPEERERNARETAALPGILAAQAPGFTLDASGFLALLRRRELARAAWRAFFADWDVLISPMALDAAFPHRPPDYDAAFQVDGDEVHYLMNFVYPMWAIFAGQPSTAFPAGLNGAGLAARLAGHRPVPGGPHDAALRPAAGARVAGVPAAARILDWCAAAQSDSGGIRTRR
jgi:amidase